MSMQKRLYEELKHYSYNKRHSIVCLLKNDLDMQEYYNNKAESCFYAVQMLIELIAKEEFNCLNEEIK